MGRIQRIAVTTTAQAVDVATDGKLFLRADGADIRIGYDANLLQYFTIPNNTIIKFDQPASAFRYQLMYCATGGGGATLEVWATEGTGTNISGWGTA